MPNRQSTQDERLRAHALLERIRTELEALADGDTDLLFAFRRKIYKELTYDERGKPMARRRLKAFKRRQQGGLCPICDQALPKAYAVLDRINAADGYTPEKTQLIHAVCDIETQASRGYS